jgi:glycosyltransferase involved in cell wall biosynthesis
VVVDNDAAGSALPVVDSLRSTVPWEISYCLEARQNISLARNRAIDTAHHLGVDAIAFVDDDEEADPIWLAELIHIKRASGADVVAGPILPRFDPGAPEWVIAGRFFEIPRYPTGTPVNIAFTGNVLVDRAWLESSGNRFDEAFGLTGGGDSHFFLKAKLGGAKIVWADGAIVRESVPASRTSARWILRRAFRVGNRYVACERSLLPLRAWLFQRLIKSGLRLAQGLVMLVPSALFGRASVVSALRRIAHSAGCLSGLVGIRFDEYDVIHGR